MLGARWQTPSAGSSPQTKSGRERNKGYLSHLLPDTHPAQSQGNKGDGLGETYLCGQKDNPLLMKISRSETDWGPQNLISAFSVGEHRGQGQALSRMKDG